MQNSIDLSVFFYFIRLYSGHKFFLRYTHYKHLHPVCTFFCHLLNSLLMRRLLNIKIFYFFFHRECIWSLLCENHWCKHFHICFLSEVLAFTFKSMSYLKLILLYSVVCDLKITFFYTFIQLSQFTCWREFLFSIKKCQFILWTKFSFTHFFIPMC